MLEKKIISLDSDSTKQAILKQLISNIFFQRAKILEIKDIHYQAYLDIEFTLFGWDNQKTYPHTFKIHPDGMYMYKECDLWTMECETETYTSISISDRLSHSCDDPDTSPHLCNSLPDTTFALTFKDWMISSIRAVSK